MGKKQTFAAFEHDALSIRGVRVQMDARGKSGRAEWKLLAADEIMGDYFEDVKTVASLKKLKDKLGVQASDRVSICLSGKQTYAIELSVRKLPDNEMPGMLKLELRKSMPFEASVASFTYQILPIDPTRSRGANPGEAEVPVIVSATANSHLNRYVQVYERAGLRPYHVDILPISIANAFWASRKENTWATDETHVMLHVGFDVCTLVIDGGKNPFFNRTFSFNMGEAINSAVGKEGGALSDLLLQMNILASEITKSLTYYRNTHQCGNISTITVLGHHASHPAFDALGKKMGYDVQTIQTAQMVHAVKPPEAGKYDLALALAMQAA
jgi:Tfp pilus assembly PilM family ATPase